MNFRETIGARSYRFDGLATLLAKASPRRSGDELAGLAAVSEEERVAAKLALAQAPLAASMIDGLMYGCCMRDYGCRQLVGDGRDGFAFHWRAAQPFGLLVSQVNDSQCRRPPLGTLTWIRQIAHGSYGPPTKNCLNVGCGVS